MLIPCEKLKEWAATVDPTAGIYIQKFLVEAETKMQAEIEAAKKCLADYGYKVYEDQHHIVHEVM